MQRRAGREKKVFVPYVGVVVYCMFLARLRVQQSQKKNPSKKLLRSKNQLFLVWQTHVSTGFFYKQLRARFFEVVQASSQYSQNSWANKRQIMNVCIIIKYKRKLFTLEICLDLSCYWSI
eukprot:TRINITY_DN4510_c0_g1_i1.p3 TRINITY_DN4510_c0_g1~~TRINITY_DN4510_c0_g1_i1.p3  ORF type:complete len:120 (-),score=2.60 TRINITY_DN4510_c0_g1_i1:394-753(-)